MALKRTRSNVGYGLTNALQDLVPMPIISNRAPTANDTAELGTVWIDQTNDAVYQITSIVAGAANWATAPASGATTLASLTVTTTADIGTNATVGGTLDVTGLTTLADLTATGTTTISGDLDLSSAALIDLTSTLNAAPSIYLHANGGTSEQILLRADQGTSATSVELLSDVGGITIQATAFTDDAALDLNANAGGITLNAAKSIALTSSEATADAIYLNASQVAGGVTVATGTNGLDVTATGGAVTLTSTKNAANAVALVANGGTSESIKIQVAQGTGATSINMFSTAGGITVNAGTALALDAAEASHLTVTGAGQDLTLSSVGGSVALSSTEDTANAVLIQTNGGTSETLTINAAQGTAANAVDISADAGGVTVTAGLDNANAIYLHANAGTSETIKIHADQGTGASSIELTSDAGGIDVNAGGGVTVDATGAVSVDSAAASNFTSSVAANAAAVLISASAADGGITLDAGATPGVTLTNGTQSAQLLVGTGSPNGSVTAAQGSLYIDVAGSTSTTILFTNTDGSTTWVGVGA